jgi:hypothetical protein
VLRGVESMTLNARPMNSAGTSLWNRSLIEFTNTTRGLRHRSGSSSLSSCSVSPNPGPDVRGSPSRW